MNKDRLNDRTPHIFIVGLGIMNLKHITVEAMDVIKRSGHILFVDSGFGVESFFNSHCEKVTNLASCYKKGRSRREAYNEMASLVLDSALKKAPVCFAVYGHPNIFVYPTYLIKSLAPFFDLNVKILPGISAFDTIITDLGIDPGFHGFQMYDSTDVLIRKRPLLNDVPCLLWQPEVTGIVEYSVRNDLMQNLIKLQGHLLRFYPKDHEISLIRSSSFPLIDPVRTNFQISQFAETVFKTKWAGSIYIPPVKVRDIKDFEFAESMLRKSSNKNEELDLASIISQHSGKAHFLKDFLSAAECDEILKCFDKIEAKPGKVNTDQLKPEVRKSPVRFLRNGNFPELHWLFQKVNKIAYEFNKAYLNFPFKGLQSNSFQLTEYSSGGFYSWHQDFSERKKRSISISIQLEPPESYSGGSLELKTHNGIIKAPKDRGTLIVFTSNTDHRVTPVSKGIRRSLVGWYLFES